LVNPDAYFGKRFGAGHNSAKMARALLRSDLDAAAKVKAGAAGRPFARSALRVLEAREAST
jgi:hypothetical protein